MEKTRDSGRWNEGADWFNHLDQQWEKLINSRSRAETRQRVGNWRPQAPLGLGVLGAYSKEDGLRAEKQEWAAWVALCHASGRVTAFPYKGLEVPL